MTTQQKVWIQFEGEESTKITISTDADIDDLKVKAIECSNENRIFPSDVVVKKGDTKLEPDISVLQAMEDGYGRSSKIPFVFYIITEGMCNLSATRASIRFIIW